MTDQETLNKLFEAALKEPEKPQALRPNFRAPATTAPATTAPATTAVATTAVATTAVATADSARSTAPATRNMATTPEQGKAENEAAATTDQQEESPVAETKAKSRKGLLLAIAPIALALIGGAIWFFALR